MVYGSFGLILKESTVREGQRGSPLALIAGQKGDKPIEACSELLKSGFQPDGLTWATIAYFDDLVLAQFLLDHHQPYNYNSPDQHKTPSPLVEAAGNHNKELVILFLKADADANESAEQYGYSRSALQQAVEVGNLDIVCCLVEAGADVNSLIGDEQATALQLAAIQGYLGIAKYLLDHGAQVNALPAKKYGRTALEGAAENGRLDMLELLLASGALTIGKWRRRFVRAVKMATREHHYTAAKLLKEAAGWSEADENMFKTENIRDEDTRATELEEDGIDVDESDVGERAANGIDVSEEYDYSWAVQGGDYIIGASYDFPIM
ncbi:ankyrin repeat-containing domain protein [Nemania diffusa]|nr:ankyrin repeat-containing domain protein [Nemania diffusa]